YNALILRKLLDHLNHATGIRIPIPDFDVKELTTVVRFSATHKKSWAQKEGDNVEEFWATTTLAGLAFLEGQEQKPLKRIHQACAIPGATFFQVQSFRSRLELVEELDLEKETMEKAVRILDEAHPLPQDDKKRVFLWSGYPIDSSDQSSVRFPSSKVEWVT